MWSNIPENLKSLSLYSSGKQHKNVQLSCQYFRFIRSGRPWQMRGPMQDLSAGPLWAVILWRHSVHSTVLRSW